MKRIIFIIIGLLAINSTFGQTDFFVQLADSALTLTKQQVIYDPSYFQIAYPNGDVPADISGGQVLADCLFSFKIIGHYAYKKKIEVIPNL